MAQISITIPDDKVEVALEGFLYIHPNNETEVVDEVSVPLYTDAEWVREKLRKILIRDIYRGLNLKAHEYANVENDDTIAT